MKAFHSNWTAPFFARCMPDTPYAVEPFELLTTLLSALAWRGCGHSIAMVTDSVGAAYYRGVGLESLWDDGIHIALDELPVSPHIYWAAGKLYALRHMPAPCVMLDTDFIVWRDISALCVNADAAVIHQETLLPDIYPDHTHFRTSPDYDLSVLDWTVLPCNTALAAFFDADLKNDYTAHAIALMRYTPEADNALTYMVLAEQRMLSMRIAARGAHLRVLSDLPALFGSGQDYFTHIWGYKQQLRADPAACDAFCRRCADRLTRDFPAYAQIAAAIPALHTYF